MKMNRPLIALILAGSLSAAAPRVDWVALAGAVLPGGTRGDVNFDEKISSLDALVVLQSAVGRTLPDTIIVDPNGDVNCSETITAVDALVILSDVVGLDVSSFCIGEPLVADVTVSPDTVTVVQGDSSAVSVTLKDRGGNVLSGRRTYFASADTTIAVVDSAGTIVGVRPGLTTLQVTSERVPASPTHVRVTPRPATISVTPVSLLLDLIGEADTLEVLVRDSVGEIINNAELDWQSSDSSVVAVRTGGIVTALSGGQATVTATFGGVVSNGVSVTVEPTATALCSLPGTQHIGDVTASEVWTAGGSPHYVPSDFQVLSGSTITIDEGVVVCLGIGARINFVDGRLLAQGTAADSIVFTTGNPNGYWGSLTFTGTPPDTSRLAFVTLERGGYFTTALISQAPHPVTMENSTIVRSYHHGASLGEGSRITQSLVEGSLNGNGVTLGGGLLEDTEIRNTAGIGLIMNAGPSVARRFLVNGTGGDGVAITSGTPQLMGGRVENAGDIGLDVSTTLTAAQPVRVIGSTSYGFRGSITSLGLLAPTAEVQDSLFGNGRDTLVITGGTLTTGTLTVRSDLPWRVNGDTYFNSPGGGLVVQAGARIALAAWVDLIFDEGSRLDARGTAALPIDFVSVDGTSYWGQLWFGSPAGSPPAPDTSRIANARFIRGGRTDATIEARESHVVFLDSIDVTDSYYEGVDLQSAGSRLRNSSVKGTVADVGVRMGAATLLEGVSVDSTSADGIYADGDSVVIRDFTVRNAGQDGVEVRGGSGVVITRGRVEGSTGVGLKLTAAFDTASGIRVVGGAAHPFQGTVQTLSLLASDRAAQDSLLGNADDALWITGGTVVGRTLIIRPDLPWHVLGDTYFHGTGGLLKVEPGTTLTLDAWVDLIFDEGARLDARGTSADSVRFIAATSAPWGQLRFASPAGTPAPVDTSFLSNALLLNGGRTDATIEATESHTVLLDSVNVVGSYYEAVQLQSPGSALRNSQVAGSVADVGIRLGAGTSIDGVTVDSTSSHGVYASGDSISITRFTVRDAGGSGVYVQYGVGHRLFEGQVEGSTGVGLYLTGGFDSLASVRVTGGGSYPFQGPIQNLAMLVPTDADQDSLLGNQLDTVIVTGGTVRGRSLTVRKALPWRVTSSISVLDSGAVFTLEPGASLSMSNWVSVTIDERARLYAVGTAAEKIRVSGIGSDFWSAFIFRSAADPGGFDPPLPPDTSVIRNAIFDHGGRGNYSLYAREKHVLLMDSVEVLQSSANAVYLDSPGSRIDRSLVDQSLSGEGVRMSDSTFLSETTISRMATGGLVLRGTGTDVRSVTISGNGGTGLSVASGSGHRVLGGRIENNGGGGILATVSMDTLADLRSVGNGAYGFDGLIQNLGMLAPTREAQDSLMGNGIDTLVVRGGTLSGSEVVVRSDLPWRVTNGITVRDPGGLLRMEPGALIMMNHGSADFVFDEGGRLDARGTAANPITITTPEGTTWGSLLFRSPAGDAFNPPAVDTSYLAHAILERGGRWGWTVNAYESHVLLADSLTVRQGADHGVAIQSPGSALRYSLIDQMLGDGLYLRDSVTAIGNTIQRSNGIGVQMYGTAASLHDALVLNNGSDGIVAASGSRHRIVGGRSEGNTGRGLVATVALDSLTGLRLVGNGSVGFEGLVSNLALLAPTRAAQDSLMGNTRDTLVITGGSLSGVPLWVRSDLPWRVTGSMNVLDSGAVLTVEPGANVAVTGNRYILFDDGAVLHARGTEAQPVRFTSADGSAWRQLIFRSPPAVWPNPVPVDTSYLTNAVLDRAGGGSTFAVEARASHVVILDSTVVKNSEYGGLNLSATGTRVDRTLVDGTQYDRGVILVGPVSGTGLVVRSTAGDGLQILSTGVTLTACEVTGSGGRGIYASRGLDVHVTGCNIFDNTGLGLVNNHGTESLDATGNWWGDAAGPAGPGGDGVSGVVDFSGFLGAKVVVGYLPGG